MKTQKIKYKLPKTRYFSLEFPETMTLSAGMSLVIPVTFRPVAQESYSDVIEFSTLMGSFYLPVRASLPEHCIDFPKSIDLGYCPVFETAKKSFTVRNCGKLISSFEWLVPEPFTINPTMGTLAPGETCSITLEFNPMVFNFNSECHGAECCRYMYVWRKRAMAAHQSFNCHQN